MTSTSTPTTDVLVRPLQRRDLDMIEDFCKQTVNVEHLGSEEVQAQKWQTVNRWYGVLKLLSMFPNPLQHLCSNYVAEQSDRLRGVIQVSPFNSARSTWKVDQVMMTQVEGSDQTAMDIGSQLLRYCFQTIWEARTWLVEVNVNDNDTLALYRHNGFQPLAHTTYWAIAPEVIQDLAEREPDVPNLLPVGNADACLLHQLDTASMPPLVRQVFDRNINDFKTSLVQSTVLSLQRRFNGSDSVSAYVFEPQRKAAIGYFKINLCRDGSCPHEAELTVHPAYTWLYPELMAQMARVVKEYPAQTLQLTSADYHPEREEYLDRIGAQRTQHTLLMSRSVWHKLRETKFVSLEGLQLSDMLPGWQPVRKPVPGRFSLADSRSHLSHFVRQMEQMYRKSDAQRPIPPDNSSGSSQSSSPQADV